MDHCCSGLKQSGFAPPSGLLAMPSTGWTYFRMQRSGEPGKCHSSLWARAEQERMGVGLITHSQWLPLDLTPQERAPGAGGSHADSNQTVQGLRHIGSFGTSLVSRNIPASSPEPVKFMSSKMPPPPPILLSLKRHSRKTFLISRVVELALATASSVIWDSMGLSYLSHPC